LRIRYAALLAALLTLVGCSDVVVNPLSPEETRRQVVDVSRQLVSDLGGEVTDAQFGYDSCGVNGTPPFQGHASFGLWMPGADRTREVTAESVVTHTPTRAAAIRASYSLTMPIAAFGPVEATMATMSPRRQKKAVVPPPDRLIRAVAASTPAPVPPTR